LSAQWKPIGQLVALAAGSHEVLQPAGGGT